MYGSWQEVLGDFIVGYYSDNSEEEALAEVVEVSIASESFHQYYLTALKEGIASAGRGERDVIDVVRPIFRLQSSAEARARLEEILAKYEAMYDEAKKAQGAPPPGNGGT